MSPVRFLLFPALVAAGVLIGFGYGRWYGPGSGSAGDSLAAEVKKQPKGYYCPMHPNVRSDKPGDCPICGMKLIPEAAAPAGKGEPAAQPHDHAHDHGKEASSALPPGTIHISPQKQQLIGVQYGEAAVTSGARTFRAVGKVSMDETRQAKVQTRIEGWIEKVFVDFTGKHVEKGQPLVSVYSPEMYASQQEYLLAIRGRDVLRNSPLAGTRQQGDSLVDASRRRLQLWDLSDAQIDEITRTGKPIQNVTIHSPMSGFVMMRNAFLKQRITPETELYTIADLSRVWVMADVFESEASLVRIGMPVRITPAYGGAGRTITGRVNYIQPQIDMTTRTLKVRIEADNPGMALKPEMFVDVDLQSGMPARVTVPVEAVLNTGVKKTVFVDRGEGHLEPRQVETGERMGDRIEITRGLRAGERIVISGNFLIDSESQLKAAASGMSEHKHD